VTIFTAVINPIENIQKTHNAILNKKASELDRCMHWKLGK